MSRVVRIEVTAEDIAKGKRQKACECPIALAVRRAAPDHPGRLGVFRRGLSFGIGTYDTVDDPPLPEEAVEFVRSFDAGADVKPFSFDLELP